MRVNWTYNGVLPKRNSGRKREFLQAGESMQLRSKKLGLYAGSVILFGRQCTVVHGAKPHQNQHSPRQYSNTHPVHYWGHGKPRGLRRRGLWHPVTSSGAVRRFAGVCACDRDLGRALAAARPRGTGQTAPDPPNTVRSRRATARAGPNSAGVRYIGIW